MYYIVLFNLKNFKCKYIILLYFYLVVQNKSDKKVIVVGILLEYNNNQKLRFLVALDINGVKTTYGWLEGRGQLAF